MSSPNVDLYKLFQIWNPRFRYSSCVGYAATRGRRCGWEMDTLGVAKQLKNIGDKLPYEEPSRATLMKVAADALCHHHQNQAGQIATKWKSIIDDLDLEDLTYRMRNARMSDDDSSPRFDRGQSARDEAKRRQERAQEEARKKEDEEERKRRREERNRENARKEQERKDHEAQGERRSWRQAWARYTEAQVDFKEKKVRSSSGIPWPVKSGLRVDVNEQNVVTFYRNALPGSSANEFCKIMQQECLIWHPDKVKQFIGSLPLTAAEEASLAVIARMVIIMHREFKDRRAS